MELNEKTYETYFLSYVDNELSATERLAVERFVQFNPKYATALQDLQNTILTAEHVEFENKFLLYRLNEMDAKLDLNFKKSLYKKEQAPIHTFWNQNMIRYSAIAALLLLTIGTALKYTVNKEQRDILSANNSMPEAKKLTEIKRIDIVSDAQALMSNQLSQALIVKNNSKEQVVTKNITEPFETLPIGVENTKTASNLSTILSNTISQAAESTETLASIEKEQHTIDPQHSTVVQNTYQSESFEEININETDRVIYISSIEIDSDKIRGFTRRLNAIFKRNKSDKQ